MDLEQIWELAWPWAWPTLVLLAWCVLTLVGLRRLFRLLKARAAERDDKQDLAPRFLARTQRYVTIAALLVGVALWAALAPIPDSVDLAVRTHVYPWLWPTLGVVLFLAALFLVVKHGTAWLAERAKTTKTPVDDALVEALRRPLSLATVVAGVNLWVGLVPLGEALVRHVVVGTSVALVILLIMFANGFAQGWMVARTRTSKVLATSGGVLRSAVSVTLYIIGGLMALSSLGIDITPIVASLGVGSLAIGLALQSTLEDFLAGLLLAADQPIGIGDWVRLESGEEAQVLSIGWRTTRLMTREAQRLIVPNNKLAQSMLLNHSRPTAELPFRVPVGVHYDSDLEHVRTVTLEVAKRVLESDPRAIGAFTPRVVFGEFAASSIDLNVWLCARSWDDHFGVADGFIRKLQKRYADEGIIIPFPIRTLDLPPNTRLEVSASSADGDARKAG